MARLTDAEIAEDRKRRQEVQAREPRTMTARYNRTSRMIVIALQSGITVEIPAHLLQGLSAASDAGIADVVVEGGGYGLHWPALDLDLSVPGLLAGVFGTRAYMAKKAGEAKSAAKAAAARKNGAKGGRPRKTALRAAARKRA